METIELTRVEKWKKKVPKGRCLNDGTTHFKKGMTPWNKGITLSAEYKKKISDGQKANNPKYWLGKKRDQSTKDKISLSNKGTVPWNKGIKQTQTSGPNNPNWKGGVSRGYKTGYYSLEYKQWRTAVFERDDYTCQECGQKGGYLTAHHIESFTSHPELRLVVSNGKTLCEDCHELTDNYKGRERRKIA
jgi:5-methylcytosine-specific restriction endonuclease McrA